MGKRSSRGVLSVLVARGLGSVSIGGRFQKKMPVLQFDVRVGERVSMCWVKYSTLISRRSSNINSMSFQGGRISMSMFLHVRQNESLSTILQNSPYYGKK